MRDIMSEAAELDGAAARTIAAGMRAVAVVDGLHPSEQKLIEAFEAELPPGSHDLDFTALTTPASKEAFLKSCVLVAFADGSITDAERGLLGFFVEQLGMSRDDLTAATRDVASSLLSHFSGVKAFRDQVLALGEQLGLDAEEITAALT